MLRCLSFLLPHPLPEPAPSRDPQRRVALSPLYGGCLAPAGGAAAGFTPLTCRCREAEVQERSLEGSRPFSPEAWIFLPRRVTGYLCSGKP